MVIKVTTMYIPLEAKLQKELQHMAAVISYNFICTGSKGMTIASQHTALNVCFHGDGADVVSQISNLSNGDKMYANAFKWDTIIVTDKEDKASSSRSKLKSIFSHEPKKMYYCGEDIKLEYLSLKSCKLDSGIIGECNLFEMAKLVIKNVKATAFGKEFVQKKGNDDDNWELPSGMTLNNLIEYVLSQMYDWEYKITRDGETESTVESNVEPEDMPWQKLVTHPPDYYFSGFFAFVLFGKFNSTPSLHLECFAKDDKIGNKKTWKVTCAHEAKEVGSDEDDRESATSSTQENVIVIDSANEKDELAFLSAIDRLQKTKQLEMLLKSAELALNKAHSTWMHMTARNSDFDKNNPHWKVFMEKEKAVADLTAKIAAKDALAEDHLPLVALPSTGNSIMWR